LRLLVKSARGDGPPQMDDKQRKPGSLIKRALFNQYNYILLGGTFLFSLVSGSWLPAIVGLGAEVLWLVLGADSSVFRRWVDQQESKEAKQRMLLEISKMLASLEPSYADRFQALHRTSEEVQSLARENKGIEATLLQEELTKLGHLLFSFLKMAAQHQRLSRYLNDNPLSDVERDIARCQRALKQEEDPRVQSSLKQALSLAQKRLRQHEQIEGAWRALSVQMETLEKSLDFLKSHILNIGTREELAAELDGLITGVATISELESSTNDLMDELRSASSRAANLNASKG
jgi:hypothetical protein